MDKNGIFDFDDAASVNRDALVGSELDSPRLHENPHYVRYRLTI